MEWYDRANTLLRQDKADLDRKRHARRLLGQDKADSDRKKTRQDSSPKGDSNPSSSIGGRLGKQTC